jgi:two-component system CheB/CheR fusion protein
MPPKQRRTVVSKRPSSKRHSAGHTTATARGNGADSGTSLPTPLAVVGIGASAGGLRALQAFFDVMPPDSGLAFLVVQHLDPTHRSEIAGLLGRHTGMPVMMADDGAPIRPNHVYTIPPNRYLAVEDGKLSLTVPINTRGPKFSIDSLFYSLGRAFGENAAGVVLSGTGTDGTQGLRTIKGYGGLAVAQDPATAEFDAMPRSAIDAGVVDAVATIEQLPEALITYFTGTIGPPVRDSDRFPGYVSELLAMLQTSRRVDFRAYKPGTLRRRIERRVAMRRCESGDAYVELVRHDAEELDRLFADLLIQVTRFFRELETWAYLEKEILPGLAKEAEPESPLRVWVPGCSTGEEAYTIAILLLEALRAAGKDVPVQIFASDLDDRALAIARAGSYPAASIENDLSPERLASFFTQTDNRYIVTKQLRESVVFVHHNLLADPPFIHLDFISCRNVLIYFEAVTQNRIFDTFAFALKPGRYLVLGNSETVGGAAEAFSSASRKARVYRRTDGGRRSHYKQRTPIPATRTIRHPVEVSARETEALALSLAREVVLERYSAACVVVDRRFQIASLFGPTHRYLIQPSGPITADFLQWLREGIRTRVRTAMESAIAGGRLVRVRALRFKEGGTVRSVSCSVEPLPANGDPNGLLLVAFQDVPVPPGPEANPLPTGESEQLVRQLEHELRIARDEHRRAMEQLQALNEELRATNEEVLSSNEELQSANEELETSKEELQSLNEELGTINTELQAKLHELEQLNDDVNNLLLSADIPIIFLDRQLRVRRFTPSSVRLFHLIPTDIGRPLADIAPSVNDQELLDDAASVLDQLTVTEQQVSGKVGEVYVRQIRPYRTGDHRIGGVTITYQDITDRARAEELSEEAKRYAETIVETVQDPLVVVDDALVIRSVNPAFCHDFGSSPARTIGRPLFAAMGGWSAPALEHRLGTLFQSPGEVQGVQIQHEGPAGAPQLMQVSARLLPLREHNLLLVAFRNVTAQVEADRLRRDVLLRMVDIEEKERHRLALEIHDETGQQVTAFLLGLDALRNLCPTDKRSLEIIQHLETRARELAQDLVGVTLQLRPTALDAQGLEGALRDFADSIRQDSSLEVDFVAAGWEQGRLTGQTESALYRVAQEAIVNVLKHAHARRLSIVLERRPDAVTLAIEDDGRGLEPEGPPGPPRNGHSGLAGMRERLHLVGGSLTIESSPGQGTTVLARVPLSSPQSS